ncbi:unnamed protein product [Mycena citricolor]|uniref:HMG box domain-containing protein n=1 Tax=Mycena citricolor TaxID=2018698 RepID=A0AAD2K3K9_9AGAR|nr:unnamed protein product [Mycena citricolor]
MPAVRTRETHPSSRGLEVATRLPVLSIISPTPRTLTFPALHNLSDSPYASPSSSPFEPDLRKLALSSESSSFGSTTLHSPSSSVSSTECRTPPPPAPLPLSAFTRTLSPFSPPSIALSDSATPSPVRRKSTSSAAANEDRRPKRGDEDYVKRPENAFILFRRKCCEDRTLGDPALPIAAEPESAATPVPGTGKRPRQADLSKTISAKWRALSVEERAKWEDLAKEKKREHEALYPNYVYRPQRASNRNRPRDSSPAPPSRGRSFAADDDAADFAPAGRRKRKSSAPAAQGNGEVQLEFVVPSVPASMLHPRSASMPPYQALEVPNVFFNTPFGPGSSSSLQLPAHMLDSVSASPTSLLPMISQNTTYGQGISPDDPSGGWDYQPGTTSSQFADSLNSSDFLRSIFASSQLNPSFFSPASSTSSSPYTPTSTTFSHMPMFAPMEPSPLSLSAADYEMQESAPPYSDYTSHWAATSPWAGQTTFEIADAGSALGDFDVEKIPNLGAGWDLSPPQPEDESTPLYSREDFLLDTRNDIGLGSPFQEMSLPVPHSHHFDEDVVSGGTPLL